MGYVASYYAGRGKRERRVLFANSLNKECPN